MARHVLVDAGPIVALLDRRDSHHQWAKGEVAKLHDPLLTCEAVLSEAFFLLSRVRGGTATLAALLRDECHWGQSSLLTHFRFWSPDRRSIGGTGAVPSQF